MTRLLDGLVNEISLWWEKGLSIIPGSTGSRLRCLWYQSRNPACRLKHIGEGCEIVSLSTISVEKGAALSSNCYLNADGGKIEICSGVLFNRDVSINASCGGLVCIGNDSLIGPGVVMRTASHRFDDPDALIRTQGHVVGNIILGKDCWVGARAVILGGVTVGDGAVIGAGALVNRDVPPLAVAVGVPARVIKFRGERTPK